MAQHTYLQPGGRPTPGVKYLLVTLVTALVIFVFWGDPRYPAFFELVPAKAFGEGQIWRLLLSPLYLGSLRDVAIVPLVLGLFGLWLLGTPLERWLSTRRFLLLFAAATVLGHLTAALVGLATSPRVALGGPSPGVWGALTAVCILYHDRAVLVVRPLPVRGKHMLWGLAAAFAVATVMDLAEGASLLPKLSSAAGGAVGALFVTRRWRPWRRKARSRSRFVVLPGGSAERPQRGLGGNGRGSSRQRRPPGARSDGPSYWN